MTSIQSHPLRFATAAVLAAALAYGWSAQAAAMEGKGAKPAQAQDKGKKAADKQASLVVLVPHVIVIEENYANGCWIRLFEDENFRGPFLTLVGPADVFSLETPLGNMARKWESATTGPRATVAAYDNENFGQKVMNFKPGQRVPDLDPKLGFFENIRSLRITCSK